MERIFTIVVKDSKLLLLKDKNNKWNVIDALFLDSDKNYTETIIREVINNTCLKIRSIESTRLVIQRNYLDKLCNYHIYIVYVNNDDVIINDDYIDYKWVNKEEFYKEISYLDNIEYIKNKLDNYLLF